MVDCKYVLLEKSSALPEVIAACIGSAATLKSAYLQLFSSFFNLLAAIGAVSATLLAAKIQIRPLLEKEKADAARNLSIEISYKQHIRITSHKLSQKAGMAAIHLEMFRPSFYHDERFFNLEVLEIPEDFSPKEWKNLSILGVELVTRIYNLSSTIIETNKMIKSNSNAPVSQVFKEEPSRNYDMSGALISRSMSSIYIGLNNQLLIIEKEALDIANDSTPHLDPITQIIGPTAKDIIPSLLSNNT